MSAEPFAGKICIVTGAASGLGLETSRQLAAGGAHVVMADINEAGLSAGAARINAVGGKVSVRPTDVTQPESVKALIDATVAEHARIDYLFNNAGIAIGGEIRDLSLEQWRRTLEVNLFGVIHGVHYGYPVMIAQGFGHIVNTASAAGLTPSPVMGAYSTSKFAVVGLSQVLAAEARDLGIAVTVVCPGFIETPILDAPTVNGDTRAALAQLKVRPVALDSAVAKILSGVARRKLIVAFPFYIHALLLLQRFAPFATRLVARDMVRRLRKLRQAPV